MKAKQEDIEKSLFLSKLLIIFMLLSVLSPGGTLLYGYYFFMGIPYLFYILLAAALFSAKAYFNSPAHRILSIMIPLIIITPLFLLILSTYRFFLIPSYVFVSIIFLFFALTLIDKKNRFELIIFYIILLTFSAFFIIASPFNNIFSIFITIIFILASISLVKAQIKQYSEKNKILVIPTIFILVIVIGKFNDAFSQNYEPRFSFINLLLLIVSIWLIIFYIKKYKAINKILFIAPIALILNISSGLLKFNSTSGMMDHVYTSGFPLYFIKKGVSDTFNYRFLYLPFNFITNFIFYIAPLYMLSFLYNYKKGKYEIIKTNISNNNHEN